ncbi:MAG: transcriptional regulatory protein [Gemmatimonadetes bacterium]|nr:transcriptional regulatory protein [Gemmatimonadota bacterium]
MNPVHLIRHRAALTQSELAHAAGTSQPTIAAYEAAQKSPTFRTLQRLAGASGVVLDVRVYSSLTREERRSLALHAAIAERLREAPEVTVARARANLARMRERHPGAGQLLREWKVLLERPTDALLPVLTDLSEWARELRHVSPFGGVLSARERTAVYRDFAEHVDRSR